MRMKRCLACTLIALVAWAGCGGDPPPFSNMGARDASRRDSQADLDAEIRRDGGVDFDASEEPDGDTDLDASIDFDASIDGSADLDARSMFDSTTDALVMDSGDASGDPTEPDASSEDDCFDEHGEFDYCRCDPPRGEDCSAAPCRAGFVCISDPCGMHCKAEGRSCAEAGDCPSGSTCSGSEGERACRREGGCADSRDCPSGFACEAGSCQDRRVRCSVAAPCPNGFVCDHSQGGLPFCVRVVTRCATHAGCLFGMFCRDVDGDGLSECIADGTCDTNSDCAPRSTCGTMPVEIFAACDNHGACRSDSDCALSARCVDLWGDGVRTCTPTGGLCNHTTDCTPPQICASPADGSPPRCVGTAL